MKFIIKPRIIVLDFVFKCIMVCLFILFIIVTIPLFFGHFILAIIIDLFLFIGLLIFFRSILWDLLGNEAIEITEKELIIGRVSPFYKETIDIAIEDIVSIDHIQNLNNNNADKYFNTLEFFRYIKSIVSSNRGSIMVKTIYKTYRFCQDIHQQESILYNLNSNLVTYEK